MKSLRDLYLNFYDFEKAKKDLQLLIEESFQKDKEHFLIPNKIMNSFYQNKELAKSFIKELNYLGYKTRFNIDKTVSVFLVDNKDCLSFCNYIHEDLNNLLGTFGSIQDCILSLIKKHPNRFKIKEKSLPYGNEFRCIEYSRDQEYNFKINLDKKYMLVPSKGKNKKIYFTDDDLFRFEQSIRENEEKNNHLEFFSSRKTKSTSLKEGNEIDYFIDHLIQEIHTDDSK